MEGATKKIIALSLASPMDLETMNQIKRSVAKSSGLPIPLHSEILAEIKKQIKNSRDPKKKEQLNRLLRLFRKRAIRTMSGIAPVAVLTKPYPCPGHCAYCPNEKNVPTSYLSNEPAVMRAIRCGYDPYRQVMLRLNALENNGHEPKKIEIIVIGGTWSYLPIKYQYWYILNCFKGANDFNKAKHHNLNIKNTKAPYPKNLSLPELKKELAKEQKKNETAEYKIIGLTLETRPDYINETEVKTMRELGCTRVEIGVQAIDDEILKKNRRGHGNKETAQATKLLRDYGFKVTYHLMPALPGSSPRKDLAWFKKLFNDSDYQPDQIKFYPTIVTKGSLLYRWYKQGKYKPYTDKQLQDLITECKKVVPEYVRIIRLIRDIPAESIVAGNLITNLRQVMQQRGVECRCIRCREAKENKEINKAKINITKYPAGNGTEYFISADSPDKKVLYGFCRLRLSKDSPIAPALIRELHVYGELVPTGEKKIIQHSGWGKKLLQTAEAIAKKEGIKKIAIISGVGVRGYYKKMGYRLKDSYMIK
ncbi:MAG TPA: tRNA uridine(34) 5-carboxymethylaminomethyl modification radical SAM/GNAT enzyme Elp3 [bacterium]|nr:tRNA uridine(34) 5-carboxymethylaminomethyl modification radical SAM/GNAT enzyme Elp3 [bacterium]HPT29503.1 tRNA uridine(34) 5-carboxymethylaminomethyl modification radical SAM/GNAT enzyme Elp3 [bacterium]